MIDRSPSTGSDSGRGLRLLIVTARYEPFTGGVETHVREVARRAAALGVEVTVLTTDPSGTLPIDEERDDVRIHRVPAWPRKGDLYWAPAVRAFIQRNSWDVVHCQGIHTLVTPLAMLSVPRHVPFVVTFHTGGHSSRIRHRLRTLQWLALVPLLRRAARLVAVSQFEAQRFARLPGVSRRRIQVIPNGADPLPMPLSPPAIDPNLILSIGRLERYKGHHRAISALPELARTRPGIRLQVVGGGPYGAELRRTAMRLGVSDRVEFVQVDSTDRELMAATLGSAAVVVLLSDYEAHPLGVTEALALGRPVVGTDSTGLHELVEQGLVAPVPPGASPAEIAGAIARQLEARPRPPVDLPSWDDRVDTLMELYRTVREEADCAS